MHTKFDTKFNTPFLRSRSLLQIVKLRLLFIIATWNCIDFKAKIMIVFEEIGERKFCDNLVNA